MQTARNSEITRKMDESNLIISKIMRLEEVIRLTDRKATNVSPSRRRLTELRKCISLNFQFSAFSTTWWIIPRGPVTDFADIFRPTKLYTLFPSHESFLIRFTRWITKKKRRDKEEWKRRMEEARRENEIFTRPTELPLRSDSSSIVTRATTTWFNLWFE